jgi:hypothetical protein
MPETCPGSIPSPRLASANARSVPGTLVWIIVGMRKHWKQVLSVLMIAVPLSSPVHSPRTKSDLYGGNALPLSSGNCSKGCGGYRLLKSSSLKRGKSAPNAVNKQQSNKVSLTILAPQ